MYSRPAFSAQYFRSSPTRSALGRLSSVIATSFDLGRKAVFMTRIWLGSNTLILWTVLTYVWLSQSWLSTASPVDILTNARPTVGDTPRDSLIAHIIFWLVVPHKDDALVLGLAVGDRELPVKFRPEAVKLRKVVDGLLKISIFCMPIWESWFGGLCSFAVRALGLWLPSATTLIFSVQPFRMCKPRLSVLCLRSGFATSRLNAHEAYIWARRESSNE